MKLSLPRVAALSLFFVAIPVLAQFIETPTDPPPSMKDLALPVVFDTLTGTPLVDEASGDGANGFIKDLDAAIVLGKALFWDMQMGSDEVACATCHYHGGADNRQRNQLSPGLNGGNGVFDPTRTGKLGPNNKLRPRDFPFHELADPADRDSLVLFDTDDVASSSGMFFSAFNDIVPGDPIDDCTPITPDPLGFHINGINTRRVEPRNTPTVINAAFNHRNFWDGRANNIFNGVDAFGQRNTAARVLEANGGSVMPVQIALQNSSLASQAMAPPLADFETSCANRIFAKIGKKLLSVQPLGLQKVHKKDSVLGPYRAAPRGLNTDYQTLIEAAISDRFWNSDKLFDAAKNEIGAGAPASTDEYTLTEINFTLIWGLAIMAYERTLISDDAPYDQWAEAPGGRSPTVDNTKGILTEAQMRGMDLFFSNTFGERGNCSTCHQGPVFSTATFPFTEEAESGEFPEREQLVERMRRGDGFNFAENLFRYFVFGEGAVGGVTLDGRAGTWELPSIYPATVSGDLTLNGVDCKVESFLMNQDRTSPPPTDESGIPPEPPGPSDDADYSTKDAVIRVSGCLPPLPPPPPGFPPITQVEIRIVDGGPSNDIAEVLPVWFGGAPAPCPVCYPIPAVFGPPIAVGAVSGDFTLEIPTVYDTAFYNIGVRPTAEDIGLGATDPFGVPLSFTQQWIDQLLGTSAPDVDAIASLNFSRVAEPFNWYGDSVFFPGGFDGHAWLTHRLEVNPFWPLPFVCFDGFGGPPLLQYTDQATCEENDGVWLPQSEFNLTPQFFPPKPGRGDDAVPAYDRFGSPPFFIPNVANFEGITNMPKAIDGAFKVSNLRNVSLTGPFFHNGGQATLKQVMEFYNRGGDFAIENLGDLAPNIHPLGLSDQDLDDLVAFLEALTDERVRCQRAPFDHPEIILPEGHKKKGNGSLKDDGTGQGKDRITIIKKVGANGTGPGQCLQPFMEDNDNDSD
jgi:cytochrome c peroxidase